MSAIISDPTEASNMSVKRYRHECPDWDFMVLDEDSSELVGCSCFSDPEFLAIRESHSKELDRINDAEDTRMSIDAFDREKMVKALVDRFLGWRMPDSVCSDTCVSMRPYPHPRYGTNLLNADEARQMIEYVLGFVPQKGLENGN